MRLKTYFILKINILILKIFYCCFIVGPCVIFLLTLPLGAYTFPTTNLSLDFHFPTTMTKIRLIHIEYYACTKSLFHIVRIFTNLSFEDLKQKLTFLDTHNISHKNSYITSIYKLNVEILH